MVSLGYFEKTLKGRRIIPPLLCHFFVDSGNVFSNSDEDTLGMGTHLALMSTSAPSAILLRTRRSPAATRTPSASTLAETTSASVTTVRQSYKLKPIIMTSFMKSGTIC